MPLYHMQGGTPFPTHPAAQVLGGLGEVIQKVEAGRRRRQMEELQKRLLAAQAMHYMTGSTTARSTPSQQLNQVLLNAIQEDRGLLDQYLAHKTGKPQEKTPTPRLVVIEGPNAQQKAHVLSPDNPIPENWKVVGQAATTVNVSQGIPPENLLRIATSLEKQALTPEDLQKAQEYRDLATRQLDNALGLNTESQTRTQQPQPGSIQPFEVPETYLRRMLGRPLHAEELRWVIEASKTKSMKEIADAMKKAYKGHDTKTMTRQDVVEAMEKMVDKVKQAVASKSAYPEPQTREEFRKIVTSIKDEAEAREYFDKWKHKF